MSDVPANTGAPAPATAPLVETPAQPKVQLPVAPTSSRKTYNIKVDGRDETVDFDASNE
jgi:hypothetical protein